jgi:hypothetical protein
MTLLHRFWFTNRQALELLTHVSVDIFDKTFLLLSFFIGQNKLECLPLFSHAFVSKPLLNPSLPTNIC